MDFSTALAPLLIVSLALLALRFAYTWITTYAFRRNLKIKHGCGLPPKYPHKDPIFGLDEIWDSTRAAKSHVASERIRRLYAQYGNTFTSQTLTYSALNTIVQANLEAVLITRFKDYRISSPRLDALSPLFGKSILLSDGAQWEHSRALLRPCFTQNQISDLTTLELHVKNFLNAIPHDGSTFDLAPLVFRLTADVTTDFMFGESILSLLKPQDFNDRFTVALYNAQLGGEKRSRFGRLSIFLPQRNFYRSVQQVHQFIDGHVDRAIAYRKSLGKEEQFYDSQKTNDRYIFLNALAKHTDDRQILRDELLTIFSIGRDATASLISSLFFVIARRPDVLQRLSEEVDKLDGKNPSFEQLKEMKYLKNCVSETLRLYPVVPTNSRVASQDTILPLGGGADGRSPIFVSAGTVVALHVHALHRRVDLWGEDANEFRPERWDREKDERGPWTFLPFSAGPRNCLGQLLTLTQTYYITARILQEFGFIDSRDREPWKEGLGVTCTSANGVKVAMKPKQYEEV